MVNYARDFAQNTFGAFWFDTQEELDAARAEVKAILDVISPESKLGAKMKILDSMLANVGAEQLLLPQAPFGIEWCPFRKGGVEINMGNYCIQAEVNGYPVGEDDINDGDPDDSDSSDCSQCEDFGDEPF